MADRLNQFNLEDSPNQLLPTGWVFCNVSEIAKVFLGKTPKKSHYRSNGKNKVVKFRDLKPGYLDFTNSKDGFVVDDEKIVSSLRKLETNDVLITSAAHSGENIGKKCAYVKEMPSKFREIFFTGELLNLRSDYGEVLAKWIYFYFLSNEGFKEIQNAVKGVHLTTGRAQLMRIKIAPSNQLSQIVIKLEKLFAKVNKCKERLEKIPTILKRFRQSVLTIACSGELTKDWREKNQEFEPAGKYLKIIQKERKIRYDKELKKAKAEGTKKPKKNFELEIYGDDEIAKGWVKAKLENLIYISGRIGWRGLKAEEYTKEGPLFLSVHSLNYGEEVDFRDAFHISMERYIESPEIQLKENDILLAKDGAGIGKIGIVKNLYQLATVNSSLLVIRSLEAFIPKFLFYFLSGPDLQSVAKQRITGSATPHLFQKDIKQFILAIPPIEEQNEIVRRVEALFKIADQIEARYQKAKAYTDKLTQSISAKAFRGEAFPQDLSDPPASELLKQIKAERGKKQAELKVQKTPKRKAKRKRKKKT